MLISKLLAGGALLVLCGLPSAQRHGQKFVRYQKSIRTASMSTETGVVTHGPSVSAQAVVTTSDLSNLDLSGFIGVDTGGGFCEWVDTAIKGSGLSGSGPVPSDLITDFTFAYCSVAASVNSGGNGGTMTWSFYPSHTTGAPHPATSDAAIFTLAGLPANTAAGLALGQAACFFINISFGSTPLAFPDGRMGYGWTFEDLAAGGVLAATYPFLACVSSCSGAGPDGSGMDDLIDQYCPTTPGTPASSFSFGTTAFGSYFTSLNIDIRELDVAATLSSYQGSTPGSVHNPDTLQASSVVIGQDWTATITPGPNRAGTPGFNVGVVLVQAGGAPAVSIVVDLAPILIGFGGAPRSQLLVTGSVLGTTTVDWGGGTPGSIAVPLNTGFVCLPWYAQAIVFGDVTGDGVNDLDPMFSSASTGIVGGH